MTLSASQGQIVENSNGTWSWSQVPDEFASGTVTVTATNEDGTTVSTTFQVTFTEVPPVVTADNPLVTVSETSTASNTGIFTDFDEAVTITASTGTVTQHNFVPNAGTWSWSHAATDEGSYPVTITATNADGSIATTTFTVKVTDAAPTVSADHLSITVPDTQTPTNTGTFADFDDAVTITASQGTVSQNNVTATSGTWSWSQAGLADGTYPITITATNADNTVSSVTFTVHVVHPPPTITGTVHGQQTNDVTPINPFSGVTITEPGNPSQILTVTVSLSSIGNGTLTNLGGFVDNHNGSYSFSGTAAQATAAIRGLVFVPIDDEVPVGQSVTTIFTITASDGIATASDSNTSVVATAVNDDPVITGTILNQLVNDNSSINPFPSVTITDPYYPAGLVNVIVTINNPYSLITGPSGTFSAASFVASGFLPLGNTQATFSGTPAQASAAIRKLTFVPTPNQVAPGQYFSTDFIVTVISQSADHDGVRDCLTHVTAASVNDAPTITGTLANQAVTDACTIHPFAGVTVKDADSPPQTLTLTVTLSNSANGSFSAASLSASGFVAQGNGVYTFTAIGPISNLLFNDSSAGATNALRKLIFVPKAGQVPVGHTVMTGFTISVSDGSATTTDNTTSVVATAVNSGPSIAGTLGNQAVNDNSTIQPFANVTVTDTYSKSSVVTVTISLNNAANGIFNPGSLAAAKFVGLGNGFYRFTGTPLNATFGLHLLTFVPTSHQVPPGQKVTTVFTISVNDGIAFTSDSSTSVLATSLEAPPTVSGIASSQAFNDNTQKMLFATASVADVFSPARTLSATITLDNAANGAFSMASLLASGFVQTGAHTGIYTYSGTANQITAALRKLVFVPTAHQVPHGQQVFTNFTVSVSDGVGTANASTTTSVTAV